MDIDKFVLKQMRKKDVKGFGSLMDIDKFVLLPDSKCSVHSFGSLMDIDKFVPYRRHSSYASRFGSLMDKIKQDLYYTLKAAILGGLFHAFITTNCEN